ncbi:MAG: double zinc ribbon domain-containing protein [Acetobacteraceae bacterium]
MARPEAARQFVRAARRAGRTVFDLLLPPTCPTCDAPVDTAGLMCAACFKSLTLIAEPFCRRCGVPFSERAAGGRHRLCPGCLAAPPVFERARAALRYDAGSERLILPLKYADRTEFAAVLAHHMARAGAALLAAADWLVPVPLHRRRLFARRYNQAALLGRALARRTGKSMMPDALVRVRATASLGEMSAAERAREVASAIAVRPSRAGLIAGRRVLLIDDVLTSGATANACARVMKAAGAIAVDVLAAARVPDPRLQ